MFLRREPVTKDLTYRLWTAVLCNQLVQNVGIATSCVPYIKPFFESLESGMIRTDDLRRRGDSPAYGYKSFPNSNSSSRRPSRPPNSSFPSSASGHKLKRLFSGAAEEENGGKSTVTHTVSPDPRNDTASKGQNLATATTAGAGSDLREDPDAENPRGLTGTIKQTIAWEVNRQSGSMF